MEINELSKNAKGGTELLLERLFNSKQISKELLDQFQIIPTRVRELDESKFRVLWIHDTKDDPEVQHLSNGGWDKFHLLVFVSYTQMNSFIQKFGIPWSKCVVIQNSIEPINITADEIKSKFDQETIKLIYTSTPHRGLELLYPVFNKLCETHDNIELDVYSSFGLYGWKERDHQYQELFEALKNHPKINYYGTVSNDEIREALKKSHIFAYPSIWEETSCLALIEAMSAGNICVHSSLGALPETASGFNLMYSYTEDPNQHCNVFYDMLDQLLHKIPEYSPGARISKNRADYYHNQNVVHQIWKNHLELILHVNPDKKIPSKPKFNLNIK